MYPVGPDAHLIWFFRDKWWLFTEEQQNKCRELMKKLGV